MNLNKANIIKIITKWTNPNFDSIYITYLDNAICRLSIYEGDNFGIISDLYVNENCRSKGIATLLIKECEEELQKRNVKYVKIYVNKEEDNTEYLLKYYNKLGYEIFESSYQSQYTLLKNLKYDI